MNIYNYFKNINLTSDQQSAICEIECFFNNQNQVFILQGYAGTGKTTLIKGLSSYLASKNKAFEVIAPTGRAAKILRDKTGHGRTIHSTIFNLKAIEAVNANSKEEAEHSVKYHFPIDLSNNNERILIVDEASMVSSRESKNELFDFGTNILLADLLSHIFGSNKYNKVIFVGDPAQLAPVGDNNSYALDKAYFDSKGYSCDLSVLKEVKRQEDNLILKNATTIRSVLEKEKRNELIFDFDNESCIKLNAINIIDTYLALFPNPAIGDGVIISFSNSQCYHYNVGIRNTLFPLQKGILAGDLVLINNNNYHTYDTELFNGDIAKVVKVSNVIVSQSAPVFVNNSTKKEKKTITLEFRKVTIRVPNYDGEIECYIIDSLLNSIDRDLNVDMMKALYINFVMRFREEQNRRKSFKLNSYKVGSEEFKTALKNDPFYNALRVKYGYAITCHKAQGGEWDKVIVDYSGRVGLSDDPLRWSYTATTRAINTLYTFNAPYFTSFSKLKFSAITQIGRIPQNTINFEAVSTSPFHNTNQHKGKSLKYWGLLEKLEQTDFRITNIESKGDSLECYTVVNSNNLEFLLQASHKGSGHFLDTFKILNPIGLEKEQELKTIFNSSDKLNITLKYSPSHKALENLYSIMQDECNRLDISITNIEEQVSQYYVNYYLVTDAVCSYIQFYFNGKFRFSTAMPKSFQCDDDKKLIQLIAKLTNYAS
ncbi:ATP-dependent DNA helicase [Winogradskyella sp. UBA3174]|uniref:ATP-dependent DNA helicase n=1 Tax=Winogradskyella sp. UBA3174 TaxID=1947785 RepID=UPI0025E17B84|nr:AAA family ATPase [Winogradskyella sp. UBA3174]|tara:strand:- start:106833 stop:108965 length:2133 start_codon:yes stop_codon:yes gene_type:complete